ncbi:Starch-binding associating with outer membrane [Flavobacterium fluvii]|uniref:Starch-binding associating with outer membrane n=1 Tax=Flavobacterium fluvii TaxID=468056 RepID=A0A1M5MWP9_9FLAO|nr:RagB/SusD family nutrient uptake outer membrane protein [Flavobacterium fluvii]SHG81193.1 Starch-binding associating with outer membrane [Flavobacterium fluvii]
MRNFKSILYISLLAVVALPTLNSCNDDDFLDRKPLGTAVEGDLPAGGFEEKAFGLYGKMRTQGGVTDWDRYWFQNIRSDDAMKGSFPGDAATRGNIMDRFVYSTTEFAANWDGHYSLIFACNDLIADVDNSGKTDAGSIINKAEASAIRGLAYFELRRDYGEVPIILKKIVSPSDGIKAKSTVAEVDVQIISDLEFAATHLPLNWPAYPGRATKGFANSILAKLYLYQGNWAKALEKSEIVINSGQYTLFNSYETLFKEQGDNCSEAIFEVQFLRQNGVDYSNNYFESQGYRGSGAWDLGWGFNVPTINLFNAYEVGDPRKNSTILFSGQDDGYGNVVPLSVDQPYWNKKAYSTPSYRALQGTGKNFWFNVKIIRYGDVILMAAEAANELGNRTKAAGYVNQIRKRARGNTAGILPDVPADANLKNAIKHERRIELAMEGERFYDLVRWGDATTVLSSLGYQDKNKYYPIPQTAVDQSGGVLKQNPNY